FTFLLLSALIYSSAPQSYTLSLHDALPISSASSRKVLGSRPVDWLRRLVEGTPTRRCDGLRCRRSATQWYRRTTEPGFRGGSPRDRKSTRLNSSHGSISYAVFCLKKKKDNA